MNKENLKKLTGLRIKELRKARGWSQEKLAELMNIGERNLSKIECGLNFLSADALVSLCNAFNVQPQELLSFKHLDEKEKIKEELIEKIKSDNVDIKLLYKIYNVLQENL